MSEHGVPPGTDAVAAPRPTRAELRRAREAADQAQPTSGGTPRGGRAEARAAQQRARSARRSGGLLTRWWFWVLLIALAGTAYLGIQSASTPPVKAPPIVIHTPSADPLTP
jgi:hypothetical protein